MVVAEARTLAESRRGAIALLLAGLLVQVLGASVAEAQVAADPRATWRTVDTEHFVVHYHEPLGVIARRVAAVSERAHAILSDVLDHDPDERTHVVLTDDTDSANGSANSVPFNRIRVFATAPGDLTALEDYDDWMTELIVHEHTHVLHLDTISGIPALINAIFGKVFPPNSITPRWFIEGVAVHQESGHTSGGRLRGSLFDMFLRMDALEDRLLRLDQISNVIDRIPFGNAWYLYGSRFVNYVLRKHGDDVLVDMIQDIGDNLIAFGMNRTAIRATGQSFEELYDEFISVTRARYEAVAEQVEAEGRVEGERITWHGLDAKGPRFVDEERIVYYAASGTETPVLRTINATTGCEPEDLVRVVSTLPSPHPAGDSIFYSHVELLHNRYFFNDIFRYDVAEGESEQLTHGLRAREVDVSPDGQRVTFVVNGASTSHLAIADIRNIEDTRRIVVRNRRFDQIYTPRWSPDGRSIAFSRWLRGGYRDVAILDVASGRVLAVTDDRALETGPSWSPDGRWLFFSSDRSSINNIYAFHLTSGTTHQVTNVIGGAFQPEVSPDGGRLVYVGYHALGYDLYSMPIELGEFPLAEPYIDDRPEASETDEVLPLISRPYNPLETLLPRSYQLELTTDGFGNQLGIVFDGGDIAQHYGYSGRFGVSLEKGTVNANLSVAINRAPVPFFINFFHSQQPSTGLVVAGENRLWLAEGYGASVGVTYPLSTLFHAESISLSYGLSWTRPGSEFGGRLDPNDPPPQIPQTGRTASMGLSWFWSNAQVQTFDVSVSEGQSFGVNISFAHPMIGSRFSFISASWATTQYFENPFMENHIFAFRYAGGLGGGFGVGGFPQTSFIDSVINLQPIGGVALRGFRPNFRIGTQFHLLQNEYRFLIARPQWSIGLLPLYLTRLRGVVFFDTGNAFQGKFDLSDFAAGVGGELQADMVLAYTQLFTVRVGLARGLTEAGETQFYLNVGSWF
ncbi:MAG: hypothetical protein AAGF12_34800 [Myxococcota bacterium]